MKKIFLYSLIVIFALSGARSTLAATSATYTLLEPLPCIEGTGQNCTKGNVIEKFTIDQYISYVFKFAIAIAVFLAVVMIIVGGFQYMLSEAFTSKQAAKERITNAVLGLLAALASYLILATIDPRLVAINTTLPAICPPGQAQSGSVCDKSAVDAFNKQLGEQFQELTTDARNQANAIQQNINTKQQRIDELQQLLDNDSDLSEDQRGAYYTELQGLKGDVSDLTAQRTNIVTQGTGSNEFKTAMAGLTDLGNYTGTDYLTDTKTGKDYLMRNATLNAGGTELYNDAKAKIQSTYDQSIKQLAASNPAAVQQLQNEEKFYLSQIDEQKNITQAISAYQNANTIYANDANYVDTLTPKLQTALTDYKNVIANNTPDVSVPPGLESQYMTLVNQRIAMIQKALDSQKK